MKKMVMMLATAALLASCQETMDQRAARDAQEFTEKKCPVPIDPEGRLVLERISFDMDTHEWKQDFLVRTDSNTHIDPAQWRPSLLDELKNLPNYQAYRDNGFNFRYVYLDMENRTDTLADLTFTKQDYAQ